MSTESHPCGLDIALAVMGGKWKPLILYHLNSGPKRFGDLKRLVVGISEKVLIQQLRDLAAADVITRRDYQRVPPMVDYTITAFGLTLAQALMPLCVWGTEHRDQITALGLSRSSEHVDFNASLPNLARSTAA
jgi:DNA-binding HxlR family transcriptional regulator